jgi:FkbM family methyltransferase
LKVDLQRNIIQLEKFAQSSRFFRFVKNPYKYTYAILYRLVIYPVLKRENQVDCITFFGSKMYISLPSGTDIFLAGGKTHDSEIRLTKFLLQILKDGNTFIDIGSHFGYFSLLAAKMVGEEGKVVSLEASSSTYTVLRKNTLDKSPIKSYNLAAAKEDGYLTFYEFPNLYSEYNTGNAEQYNKEAWYTTNLPQEIKIKSVNLDNFFRENELSPDIIKIDVEGGEYSVLLGLSNTLAELSPIIIMEYLSDFGKNLPHREALDFMKSMGYLSYIITGEGKLTLVENMALYFNEIGLDSDNIVFCKI